MPARGDLVLVEWIDSYSTDMWLGPVGMDEFVSDPVPNIRSVGWLEHQQGGHYTLAADINEPESARCRLIRIPKACVTRVTVLRKVNATRRS